MVLSLPLFQESSIQKTLDAMNEDIQAYAAREKVIVFQSIAVLRFLPAVDV